MCKPNQQPNTSLKASIFCGSNDDNTEIVAVPTFREDSTPELDALRTSDPFMYYSIPMDQVDRWNSQGSEEEDTSGRLMVTRRSAVSVERHAIPSIEELMRVLQQDPTAASSLNQDEDMSSHEDEDFDYLDMLEGSLAFGATSK
jgi:hypothetical protein